MTPDSDLAPSGGSTGPSATDDALVACAWDALRGVDDPEVGMNIVDVGLVYEVGIVDGQVIVRMTMTSAACPMGEDIVEDAMHALRRALPSGTAVDVELVWAPPWTPERMSGEARAFFGWDTE